MYFDLKPPIIMAEQAEISGMQILYCIVFAAFLLLISFILTQVHISHVRKGLEQKLQFSKRIIENAKTLIIICSTDGTVLMFNRYAEEVTGYSRNEVEGHNLEEVGFLNEDTDFGKLMREVISKEMKTQSFKSCFRSGDNRTVHVLWNIDLVNDADNNPVYIAAGMDVTDLKAAESRLADSYQELESLYRELLTKEIELRVQFDDLTARENELRRSEERYRLAVEGVNDGIWDWDGKDGKLFMSKQGRLIMGIDDDIEPLTIEKWFGVIAREDIDRFIRSLNQYITEPQDRHFQMECRLKPVNGEIKWIRIRGMAIWDDSGIPVRVAGSITDITEQKRADEKIHKLAFYDSLTGLPNRALLADRFTIAAANARRKGTSIAVFFLDLDNFKSINDAIGHAYGDMLLLKAGEQLRLKLRKSDTLARLGGDEFIMLQTNVKSMDEVYRLAARMLDIFKKPWMIDEREFYVTASIGISVFPNDGSDLQDLMKNADAAMYRAKEAGKNNFQIFTQELNVHIMKRMEIETRLRKAVEKKDFVLHYQPQIELATGRVKAVEALIRWQYPDSCWMMPESFIHIAEETGLIGSIGEWVLATACRQLKKWHDEGHDDLRISVNLSAKQFQSPDLLKNILDIIEKSEIDTRWLELEITESLAMQSLEHTTDILKHIREAGIGVSLDDFGKGYSSLNYLKALPITNLKIDKTFIHGISYGSNQSKIVKALISLAHSMDLTVTAEGVESSSQLEFLMNELCDTAQGYLFSEPKPAKDVDLSSYSASC